jgi:hypothetical protein
MFEGKISPDSVPEDIFLFFSSMTLESHVPLAHYRFQSPHQKTWMDLNSGNTTLEDDALPMVTAKRVFVIKSQPQVVPLDVNMQWLMDQGWNPELDRIRYSPEQLYIRRFDPTPGKDMCVIVQLQQSMYLTIYGNDQQMVEVYFQKLFLKNAMDVKMSEMGVLSRQWVDSPHELLFYCGSVHSAFGVWGRALVEMQLNANYQQQQQQQQQSMQMGMSSLASSSSTLAYR